MTPIFAQSQETLSDLDPLNAEEKRDVLKQLDELGICREQIISKDAHILEAQDQCAKERAAAERELQAEVRISEATTKERDLAIQERDLEREQKETWKRMYQIATAKPSLKCRIFSAMLTLGIYQCQPREKQ